MDIRKVLRESLEDMDLFHLRDILFQYYDLDEALDPVEIAMRDIVADARRLNQVTSQAETFLRFKNSKQPEKQALYLVANHYLDQ